VHLRVAGFALVFRRGRRGDVRGINNRAPRINKPRSSSRENTMFIAFVLEAAGIWALSAFGHHPVLFVMLSGLVFFAWSEI
jgi:hypothetical protein